MKKITPLFFLLCLAGTGSSTPAGWSGPVHKVWFQETRERITVRWLVTTLKRMGETRIANRLADDYYNKKRIRFEFIPSSDGNAMTDPGIIRDNRIILSESMLNIAEADRLLKVNPYSETSPLISYALTVVHEYVHLDQTLPLNYPRWEDPAWQVTDKTLSAWVKKVEAEYHNTRKLPSSAGRTAKLKELKNIIRRLQIEVANTRNSINANVANGSLSAGQQWLLNDSEETLKKLQKAIFDYESLEKVGTQQPTGLKDPGYWELTETVFYDNSGGSTNYSLSAADGTLKAKWSLANDLFDVTANYSSPPRQIRPGSKTAITLSVSVNNKGDAYSANGDLAIYFDKPEVEPGVVISPIGLKNEKGLGGGIAFTHKPGIPPSPASSLQVYIDASTLPKGKKGDRIALLVSLYIGRSAGCKYIYSWKDNW